MTADIGSCHIRLKKAKIGIVPAGVDYDFPAEAVEPRLAKMRSEASQSEYSPRAFLRALSKLSDEELDQIVIPTRILVKLLGGR